MAKNGFALFLIMLIFFGAGCGAWIWSDNTLNGPLGLQLEVAAYIFWALSFAIGLFNTIQGFNNKP